MGIINNNAVKYGSIIIGDNCNISWDVTFMPNTRLGNNCIVAPGAIVTHSFPDGSIVGAAKFIEDIEQYYLKVKDKTAPLSGEPANVKLAHLKNITRNYLKIFRLILFFILINSFKLLWQN